MDMAQIVSNTLPFGLSYGIMILKRGIPQLADGALRVVLPPGVRLEGNARRYAIDLTLHVYSQLSFILSLLLSTVSALALTLISDRRVAAVLVTFLLIIMVLCWVLRWQTLGANPAQRAGRDREMSIASFIATTVMLFTTLYARGLLF
jgi:hypothetical protein